MKIETKFNFCDEVIQIGNNKEQIWKPCEFCGGSGNITGSDKSNRLCPDCYGNKGKYEHLPTKWMISQNLTIGEMRIEHRCKCDDKFDSIFDNYGPQTESYKEQYMCYETGIGSGALWPADQLFYTKKEAQSECDRLNKIDSGGKNANN